MTHALLSGSPAIDAGSDGCPPPDTDQRGVARPIDGNSDATAVCDIGAYEAPEGTTMPPAVGGIAELQIGADSQRAWAHPPDGQPRSAGNPWTATMAGLAVATLALTSIGGVLAAAWRRR